ncbi:glycosyltransferase family 39 protein [Wenzhouxiangella marina]|uniref:Uncharacterized protein n=1 Tax=Wenzhouxiangella marina TaxID=1579979 RepID=A0A0K0XXZ0_9GAMM|nr:glycosyltransferase family 39 protein [Wenzhouxiangella marina]AKS42497.1 hypothetical protein WM2015_2133 [Wenzhouxiangella marina]MBB6085727.1 hypothetical protein [Wenzhouxiangella marina]
MSRQFGWTWGLAWALVIALGVWLRFWQIDLQILIDDEWHAVHRLMQASYREIFLSFGHADYTIPQTLWFKFLADTIGLSEWRMRALPLLFGSATIVLLPWALRPWLDREARWLFAVFIAISPLLIHFTRYVRPYALTVPLGFLAMVGLWRWWHEGSRGWLAVFIVGAVACAWLHPLTLLFTGSALLWFLARALHRIARRGRWDEFWRIVPVGALVTVLAAALVLPPLLADPSAMQSKSGIHGIQWVTFLRAWELIVGTASWPVSLAMALLALIGGLKLLRRDPGFAGYWAFMSLVAVIVIIALQPAWIHHALVLVRYSAVFQPMILALVTLGLIDLLRRLAALGGRPAVVAAPSSGLPLRLLPALLLPLALVLSGPLPQVYRGLNQFTSHMRYHFDYDFERSIYTQVMAEAELPEVYRAMAAEPGEWTLIEAPWHFESHFSPLSEYQRFHQLPIRIGMISGLCTDWTYGELEPDSDQDISFDRFVFLESLLYWRAPENRFVVFHRGTPFGQVRELPDVEPCIERFRERFGAPWFEDEDQVVFRLEGSPSED